MVVARNFKTKSSSLVMQVSPTSLMRCAVRIYPLSAMRYILTFEDVVISIVTEMLRMVTSLHIEWQKTLKVYSKNMATMHPDTTEHLSLCLFTNKDRASYIIKVF